MYGIEDDFVELLLCSSIWEGNPLKCDCKSVQLWLHVRAFGSNHSPITCASPHEVAGMDIYYVQKDSLVCGKACSQMDETIIIPFYVCIIRYE